MNSKKILSPMNDYLFKLMFYDDKDMLLKKLLADCIEFDNKQVSEITLLDRTEDKEHRDDKLIIFDIKARLNDGTYVNVEIQKINEGNYIERSLFYTNKAFTKQGISGLNYKNLNHVVSLNIIDFNLFPKDSNFYRSFYLEDTQNKVRLTNLIRIDYMELRKIDLKYIDNKNKKALWVKFFNAKTEGDLDMIKDIDNTFEKPVEKLKRLSSDPRVLTQYEEEEKRLADEISRISYSEQVGHDKGLKIGIEKGIKKGIEQGISQGIDQGVAKTKVEVVTNMLERNYSIEEIISLTGLDEDTINKIIH